MENLLETTTLRIDNKDYIFHRPSLQKGIERASLESNQKKKLSNALRKSWGNSNEQTAIIRILTQCQGSVQYDQLIGFPLGTVRVHFFEEMCRFRHILGLADAVHLSMFNLNVQVSFPQKKVVRNTFISHLPGLNPKMRWRRTFKIQKLLRQGINPSDLGIGILVKRGGMVFNRLTTKNRRFRLILHYLKVFPLGLAEKEYVKLIKNSLVDLFCLKMDQERPEKAVTVSLFPEVTQRKLDKRFNKDKKGRVRFYKNLLESKSLCAPVGTDMILEAYEKHRASLCRPESDVLDVPIDFLQKLRKYGEKVGKWIKKDYDPHRTSLPNTRATVESNRNHGGARGALKDFTEVQKGPLYLSLYDGPTRPEPLVIGLFGPPGVGKTTSVNSLTELLGMSLFPSREGNELIYSRSCSSKHWDGYTGQPIVILDDFGQDLLDRSDIVEFEQLVSVNRYLLPMADLPEKGTAFTSPIIIVTSNCAFGMPLASQAQPVVEEDMAVWRRFHVPLRLSKTSPRFEEYSLGIFMDRKREFWGKKHAGEPRPHFAGFNNWPQKIPEKELFCGHFDDIVQVGREVLDRYRSHIDYHGNYLVNSWRQYVSCYNVNIRQSQVRPLYEVSLEDRRIPYEENDVSISQIFPRYPPFHAPVVEAFAIPEELKVRMITKGEADTKVLQPFQRSLFRYLQTQPQFVLTHGVNFGNKEEFQDKLEWIYRIEGEIKKILDKKKEGDLWLSGDYTAATDNFPMSVTSALIEGILSQIDHEPTRQWVRYEVSPHDIRYPHGIPSGRQTSGQLMGSLLSFPLLCFLNDFIVQEGGFEKGKYLINGDDVVALGPDKCIRSWREKAPQVGLSLSLGKNFIDPDFCTVNSQLFYHGEVLHTGKVSLSTRTGKTLSRCYAEMQFYFGTDVELRNEFIRRNLLELRKTPRSLEVPVEYGGLGLVFSNESFNNPLAVETYLCDYLRSFTKSVPVPGYDFVRAMRVPTGFFTNEEMLLGGGSPEENRIFDQLSSLDITSREAEVSELTCEALRKNSSLIRNIDGHVLNQLRNRPISEFPPLGQLRYRVIYIEKGKVGFLKERILRLCLKYLLQSIDSNLGDDPDEDFSLLLEEHDFCYDPLFGDHLTVTPLEEDFKEINDDNERYMHLLPNLEPRLVPLRELDEDLVSLVKGVV